ncbi:MAG: ECF transporter S component [bacterium]|nr:ECF transporter S component [bacterium]
MNKTKKKMSTETLVLSALMTSLVILFQLLATYTTFFGPFSTAIGLIPIAIGAILCGPAIGAWLGLVFAIVILASGGANLFFAVDIPGTFITVLAKGVLCGFLSGITFKLINTWNKTIATISAAIICPIVNTGIFMLGCFLFFMDDVVKLASALGSAETGYTLFVGLALGNFVFELITNMILTPIVSRLIDFKNK